jgi:murein L,D-transpeptidase YcbB/YkuD
LEKEKVEVIQEQEDIYNEEDFKTMSLNKDKKEEKNNSLEEEVIEKKKFEKRTIKCFTHINSTMKVGSIKNIKSEVEKLEIFLNKYYNANLEVDGIFDEDDKEAVVGFQNIKSLESDGIVGPKTLRIINAVYCVKNEKKN